MLVLSRKQNESVVITSPGGDGGLITIMVVEIRGGRVKLGFEAADDVLIRRSELSNHSHVGTEHKDGHPTGGVAAHASMPRWEDDGGAAAGLQRAGNQDNGSRRQRHVFHLPPPKDSL